jgi:hypothetical protein
LESPVHNNTRRIYTLAQYRADLAALDLRHHDAPALRQLLDEQLTASLELPPVSAVVRRPTLLGGLVATVAESAKPVTAAVLRAVGLSPRPSGRLRCGLLPVLLALAAVLFSACTPEEYVPVGGGSLVVQGVEADADLVVWTADEELRTAVLAGIPRIAAATGLVVVVSESYQGVPVFWSERGQYESWLGITHMGGDPFAEWVGIEPRTPDEILETVVLHELLHCLGGEHVEQDAGVLSPKAERAYPLTAADLEEVCSMRDCPAFQPEG